MNILIILVCFKEERNKTGKLVCVERRSYINKKFKKRAKKRGIIKRYNKGIMMKGGFYEHTKKNLFGNKKNCTYCSR